MQNNQFQSLWTISYKSDFSITEGHVDHSKSKYYNNKYGIENIEGIKEAYHELWNRLGIPDGQIVWCYIHKDKIPKNGEIKIKWELRVPKSEIICFIDDMVWNRILGIRCREPKSLYYMWRNEGLAIYGKDTKKAKEHEKKCREDFWNQEPKSGCWWDELFVCDHGEGIQAIIKHPVPKEWVCGKPIICPYSPLSMNAL